MRTIVGGVLIHEITEENLQKAYQESCKDVQKVLENLFPEAFESEDFDLSKLKTRKLNGN